MPQGSCTLHCRCLNTDFIYSGSKIRINLIIRTKSEFLAVLLLHIIFHYYIHGDVDYTAASAAPTPQQCIDDILEIEHKLLPQERVR